MNYLKLLPLLLAALLVAYLSGMYAAQLADSLQFLIAIEKFIQVASLFLVSIIMLSFISSFFYALIDKDIKLLLVLIVIISTIFTLGFSIEIGQDLNPLVITINFLLISLGLFVSHHKVEDVYGNSIKANISRSSHEAAKSLFLILAILISFNYYTINAGKDYTDEILDSLIDKAITPAVYIAEHENSTQETEIIEQINNQLSNTLKLAPGTIIIEPSNIEFDNIEETLKPVLKDRVNEMIEPYAQFVTPTLAIVLYLTLVPILAISAVLLYPISFIFIRILKMIGYVSEEKETVEVIRLKV